MKPDDLNQNFGMLDMLAAIITPATISSVWPGLEPKHRITMLFTLMALNAASVWWSSTVAQGLKIKRAGKRFLLHIYAFLAFVSFIVTVVSGVGGIAVIFESSLVRAGSMFMISLIVFLASLPLTASIFYVENLRRLMVSKPPLAVDADGISGTIERLKQAKDDSRT